MVFLGLHSSGQTFGLKFYENQTIDGDEYWRLCRYTCIPQLKQLNTPLAPWRAWPGSRMGPVFTEPGSPWSILTASLGAKCSLWTASRAMTGQQEVLISTPWTSSAGASWSPRSSPPCLTPCSSWRPGFDWRLQTLTKTWSEEPVLTSMPGAGGWWRQLVDTLSRKLNKKWTIESKDSRKSTVIYVFCCRLLKNVWTLNFHFQLWIILNNLGYPKMTSTHVMYNISHKIDPRIKNPDIFRICMNRARSWSPYFLRKPSGRTGNFKN